MRPNSGYLIIHVLRINVDVRMDMVPKAFFVELTMLRSVLLVAMDFIYPVYLAGVVKTNALARTEMWQQVLSAQLTAGSSISHCPGNILEKPGG